MHAAIIVTMPPAIIVYLLDSWRDEEIFVISLVRATNAGMCRAATTRGQQHTCQQRASRTTSIFRCIVNNEQYIVVSTTSRQQHD